ncbi:hypothetical protein K502DRAFT_63476 [Neoconidiobolus thromboides FSU 785]|nr:hypothetical protein K502DRAFT_63476 [Neoconidiobolus thromboides FSU 785]
MSSTDRAASLVSECLLKGMIMTTQICPDCPCPLMRDRKTKVLHCPVCEEEKKLGTKEEENLQIEDIVTEKGETLSPETVNREDDLEANGNNKKRRDEISETIGAKLLQGWALLDTLCPNSKCQGIPLVRNKEKHSLCVSCGTQYILEKDYDEKIHGAKRNLSEATAKPKDAGDLRKMEYKKKLSLPNTTSKSIEVKSSKDSFSSPQYSNLKGSFSHNISSTEKIAIEKINSLNDRLSQSNNIIEIENLAKALLALQKLVENTMTLNSDTR